MKNFFKKLFIYLRIFISIALLCIILVYSYNYLNKKFIGQLPKQAATGFKAMPENNMDVVVIGSSHAQYSFMPGLFYEETGLYSYVMASQCQPIPVSYQILREVLKTQNPRLIILEIFTATPLKSMCEADSCYVAAQSLLTGEEKMNVISYLPEDKAKEYEEKVVETYNDFLTNHNMWKDLTDFSFLLPDGKESESEKIIDYSLGYVYQDGFYEIPTNYWHLKTHHDIPQVELEAEDLEALNNIYELCQENNIELLLYKTPMDSIDALNQAYRYEVWKWADERNIKYVDFVEMTKELSYYMWIHSDSFHANISGAGIMTNYLANYIKDNNYNFNHHSIEEIDDVYSACGQDNAYGILIFEHLPETYLKILSDGYEGDLYIKYQANNIGLNGTLLSLINKLGFKNFDGQNTYYAYARNGELVKADNKEIINNSNFEIKINEEGLFIDNENRNENNAYLTIAYINDNDQVIVKNINLKTAFDMGMNNYDRD